MKDHGLFISFEGIDGAGKSTHIPALAEEFRKSGRTVTLTREPGGTPLAEKLRAMVLNDNMDALTESLLVFAARRDHLGQLIEPALSRGEVVLCDRFTDATFAYQGGGRGYDLKILSQLEGWVQSTTGNTGAEIRQPDLTVWFDIPPAIAAQRLADARTPDKFEAESLAFFTRVAAAYGVRLQSAPDRFVKINANQPKEEVWLELLSNLKQRRWLN
jgi:dTMP kinase